MDSNLESKRSDDLWKAVSHWKKEVEALERKKATLAPPPPPPVVALNLVSSKKGNKGLGVDLICNSCRQHIPKSENLKTFCQFFCLPSPSEGGNVTPAPLSRWFARCPNCNQCFRLVRNTQKFIYVSEAELSEHEGEGEGEGDADDGDLDAVQEIYDLDWNDGYEEAMFEMCSDVLALVDSPSGVPLTLPPRDEREETHLKLHKARLIYEKVVFHARHWGGKGRT